MSTTEVRGDGAKGGASTRRADMKLEVVVIPVADVDRAAEFYREKLGWRVDADFKRPGGRLLQFTPPGSRCSIIFGTGITPAAPGSAQFLHLVVSDIEAAREELVRNGVDASEVFHDAGGGYNRFDPAVPVERPRSGTAHLRILRGVQRPGWQRLAAAGDHARFPAASTRTRPRTPPYRIWRARCDVRRSLTASTRSARDSRRELGRLVCRVHGRGAVGNGAAVVVTRPCGLGVQVGSCAHDDRGRCLSHAKRGGARTNSACS